MDFRTALYIVNRFPQLQNKNEAGALAHSHAVFKIGTPEKYEKQSQYQLRIQWYRERGMYSDDPEVLQLLKDGLEPLYIRIASRIMSDTPEKVFLNLCPKCGKLARTPYARQCRYCAHNWHDTVVATFKVDKVFALNARQGKLFFAGELRSGVVQQGMKLDLTFHGVALKPEIESIEFTDNIAAKQSWVVLIIGIEDAEDREYLLNRGVLAIPVDIEK